ncbi:TIGR02530 family flagellar biosynthesis protein [Paenibacillus sp. GCM10023252]|uniref:TIGR02530 family flagellar biosynthesis protein n=1 Tax=Paenibacillus sp. GCM10023252 TaxID=3252649 RepID=UPI0036146FBE
MSDSIKIGHLFPLGTLNGVKPAAASRTKPNAGNSEFQNLLQANVLKFSHHAEVRMQQRGIQLQPESLVKIANAIDDAASKGAVDSLIVYRDLAMIVNVPSRTVVTAMDGNQMKSNVFTKIDSAVIIS